MAALLTLALPGIVRADAVTYSSGKRVFKVGILLVDSTIDGTNATTLAAGQENPDPYVFQIADQRKDVKPVGWEFVNPLAPRVVTQDIRTRWLARDPNNPYTLGAQITKDMAAYWEVSLTQTSITDLLQFDVLLLTTHRSVRFLPTDREKLRKLSDGGGMLWMDDCGGMRLSPQGPFFLEQLQFQGSRPDTPAPAGTGNPIVFQPNHAILTTPYRLSLPQIALIGEYTDYRNRSIASMDPITGNPVQAAPNPNTLTNVVGNSAMGGLPYVAVANYGSGIVVATSGDTGCAINDYVGGTTNAVGSGPNSGAYMRNPRLERAHDEDLLFLYNLVQLGSSNNTYRRNNRRVGASGEYLRAPLTTAFDFTSAPAAARVNSASAPLVVRDRVYVSGLDTGGALTVRCYNAKPSFNRGDQGLPDLSTGLPYDEIWRVTRPNPSGRQPSSPVLATVFDPGTGRYNDVIFVVGGAGELWAMSALPTDNAGNPLPVNAAVLGPNNPILKGNPLTYDHVPGGVSGAAPAPVFFENRIYVVQTDGVVRCVDANLLTSLWTSVDVAPEQPDMTPTGTPTLGVVRLSEGARQGNQIGVAARSGGNTNDIMLYVPTWRSDASSGAPIGRVVPLWLGTRHEVIEQQNPPGSYNFPTRVATGGTALWVANTLTSPLPNFVQPRVRVYNSRADMLAGIENTTYTGSRITDAGVAEVRDSGGNAPPPNTPMIVSVDYDTLPVPISGTPGVPPGMRAGTDGARSPGLAGGFDLSNYDSGMESIALGPEDIQFFAGRTSAQNSGGGTGTPKTVLMGLREQADTGNSKLRQAFTVLEDGSNFGIPMNVSPGGVNQTIVERATFRLPFSAMNGAGPGQPAFGVGATATLAVGEGTPLSGVTPVGPPVISQDGGTVYQLMQSASGATILAAFDADRDVTIRVKPFQLTNVRVAQANALAHPDGNNLLPLVETSFTPNANQTSSGTVDLDPDAGRITLRSMIGNGGRFSSSQSFVVTYTPQGATQPITQIVSPSARLQVINNGTSDVVDNAALPQDYNPLLWYYVLPTNPTGPATRVGEALYFPTANGIVAVDADPAANDPDVRAGEPIRNVVDRINGNPTTINHVRWVRSLPDGAGGQATSVAAVTAGADVLVVNTAGTTGTYAFENSTTLIADSSRIIEVSGDATPLWAMDGTVDSKIVGGNLPIFDPVNPVPGNGRVVIERRGLTRPSVVRKLGSNDYLIADTGNNRILRATRSAAVSWELVRVTDPFGVLEASDPLVLANPTDVQLYTQPTFDPADPFNNVPLGYEDHYLIADPGNYRVIEVVDYRDRFGNIRTLPGGQRGEKVVVWSSRTLSRQGRKLSFKSAQRVYVNDGVRFGIPQLIATVDNTTVAGGTGAADFTGSSLVQLDYRPINTLFVVRDAASGAIRPVGAWPTNGNPTDSGYPWVLGNAEPTTNGLVASVVDSFLLKAGTQMLGGPLPMDRRMRLTRPTFFQQLTLAGNRRVYYVCDANGAYQLETVGGELVATWFLLKEDYQSMAAARMGIPYVANDPNLPRFHPVSALRLPSGNILISNAAAGPSGYFEGGHFRGEALEVTGDSRYNVATPLLPRFGGFAAPSWSVTVTGGRPIIKQQMGAAQGTHPLEQPLYADRL